MTVLHQWAIKWGVRVEALQDLQQQLGLVQLPPGAQEAGPAKSEAWAQSAIRMEGAQKGVRLWRNNVGALKDQAGRLVRFGLANDSEKLNEMLKSSDLVGWRPVVVTPPMLGMKIAQTVLRECKEPGWQFTDSPRERAQWNFMRIAIADGADACFATGPGTL